MSRGEDRKKGSQIRSSEDTRPHLPREVKGALPESEDEK